VSDPIHPPDGDSPLDRPDLLRAAAEKLHAADRAAWDATVPLPPGLMTSAEAVRRVLDRFRASRPADDHSARVNVVAEAGPPDEVVVATVRRVVDELCDTFGPRDLPGDAVIVDEVARRLFDRRPAPDDILLRFYEVAGVELHDRRAQLALTLGSDETPRQRITDGGSVTPPAAIRAFGERRQQVVTTVRGWRATPGPHGRAYILIHFAGRRPAEAARLLGCTAVEVAERLAADERALGPLATT
jgi:hypothetical protein